MAPLIRPGFVIRMDKASQSQVKRSKVKLWQVLAIPLFHSLLFTISDMHQHSSKKYNRNTDHVLTLL